MPQGNDLFLISAVIEATLDEREKRGLPLAGVTQRLFALVECGERDFEVLKSAALKPENNIVELADHDGTGSRLTNEIS